MRSRRAWLENIVVGADALRIHPMRTMLSVLGILIGSASLVATMAVSDGMMDFARGVVLRETSAQVISLRPRTGRFEEGEWVPIRDYPVFAATDAEAVRSQLDLVQATTLSLGGSARVRYRGIHRGARLLLGTASLPEFGSFEVGAGRFFSEGEAEHNVPVVLLNYALARELNPGRDPYGMIGHEVRVKDRARLVIGVLAPADFENPASPSFGVYAPIRAASALLDLPRSGRFAPVLQVLAPSVEAVSPMREQLEDWLARRYGRWRDRVEVSVSLEQLDTVEQAFLLMKLFVGALVGISLLVGGIGIMNVLLASVAERTREIGIRKSVGARGADIRVQFLTESVAIAFTGSCLGFVIGMLIALAVTALFHRLLGAPIHPVLSWNAVLIPTVTSSLVGLVFGTYPARRAAKLSPIRALAHE